MSYEGTAVLAELRGMQSHVAAELSEMERKSAAEVAELATVRQRLAATFDELAEFYLAANPGEHADTFANFSGRSAALGSRVKSLLEQRESALYTRQQQLAECQKRQQQLRQQHDQRVEQRDASATKLEERMAECRSELLEVADFVALRDQWQNLKRQQERVARRLEAAEEDREEKRLPYESDALFGYLQRREFGTPQYSARGLTRIFDERLAAYIGYVQAAKNFQMLVTIPKRLAEHETSLERQHSLLGKQLDELHEQKLLAMGGQLLRDELAEAESAVQQSVDDQEQQQQQRGEIDQVLALYARGEDDYSSAALAELETQLEHQSVRELSRLARNTESPDDDRLVAAIEQLRDRESWLNTEVNVEDNDLRSLQKRQRVLDQLLSEYERRDWDSLYSSFSRKLDLSRLSRMLSSGEMDYQEAISWLARHQQFRYRNEQSGRGAGGSVFPQGRQGQSRSPWADRASGRMSGKSAAGDVLGTVLDGVLSGGYGGGSRYRLPRRRGPFQRRGPFGGGGRGGDFGGFGRGGGLGGGRSSGAGRPSGGDFGGGGFETGGGF